MSQLDKNANGALESAELIASPGLQAGLDRFDRDSSGSISAQEIEDRVQYYKERLGNLTTYFIELKLDGTPLPEAEVQLVPDAWLGTLPTVTGKSDEHGTVVFRMPEADESGVHPGVYRLVVSKKDVSGNETLPAKYNTQTILGQEVAPDRRELESHVPIALSK
jgi:hypothetical protein